ncbi:hypothetical protein [Janthinobacterium sp. 17J80-10]|uniref:hypothetical protein n=1 Tax=Janthinobacterium sp. 17J80-10 TaxID=2497863 RepID=UPI001005A74D|nr:hypothetical protein [Janthinobacterium sp. 17J80-10]QAU33030.1 hypothetical protein EKL02_01925 [Janthinobacterium sp. 17J80-10]
MKKLAVTMKLEMSIPDDWELVKTSTGVDVIKLPNNQFLDLTFEPLFAADPEDTWTSTDDDTFLNDVLDLVESEEVTYEIRQDN